MLAERGDVKSDFEAHYDSMKKIVRVLVVRSHQLGVGS